MKNDTKDFQEPTFNQLDPVFKHIYDRVKDYTLTSGHRLYSLYNAVRYLDEQLQVSPRFGLLCKVPSSIH